MSTFESLSSDEQKRILDMREEGGKKRKEADKQAMDTVSSQSQGVKYLKDRRIGLNPEQKGDIGSLIQRWLVVSQRSIQHTQDSERGTRNLERIKKFFYSKYVPTLETFPRDEFLRVQEEANIAQGRGRITNQLTSEQINQGIEIEINNIKDSLDPWIEYFTSPDSSSFPIWAKYWAFLGVVKMSGKMKTDEATGKISFPKRETNTISGFPELNREALAKAVDYIVSLVEKGQKLDTTLTKEKFSDVYSHFIIELKGGLDQTELQITEGTWVKYDQGNDDEAIDALVDSLQGKFTNWCTAGRSTAERQLAAGDFYVYYTKSASGKPNPRIAIRMEGKKIGEIRGIRGENEQNLDEVISGTDILDQKLVEFGEEGEKYKIKAENMRRLTVIYNKLRKDSAYQLSDEDLNFLEGKPKGFGYKEDPRIKEVQSYNFLRNKYNFISINQDTVLEIIKNNDDEKLLASIRIINPELHNNIFKLLIKHVDVDKLVKNKNLMNFQNLSYDVSIELIERGFAAEIIENKAIFKDFKLDDKTAKCIINSQQASVFINNMGEFTNLKFNKQEANEMLEQGHAKFVIENKNLFDEFELDSEVAIKILKIGKGHYEEETVENDVGSEYYEIDWNAGELIKYYIDEFKDLNLEVAIRLIEYSNDHNEIARFVLDNSHIFQGFKLNSELASYMINLGQKEVLAEYIHLFSDLTAEIALSLFKDDKYGRGYPFAVEYNLDKFTGFESKELEWIENGFSWFVIDHKDKFPGFELNSDAALLIISNGGAEIVAENISRFKILNLEVAKKLLKENYYMDVLINNDRFIGLKLNSNFALEILKRGSVRFFEIHIEKFSELNSEVAKKLIDLGHGSIVSIYIKNFKNLDLNVAKILVLNGFINIYEIKSNQASFNFDVRNIESLIAN